MLASASPWLNALAFAAGAAVIWWAGTRLEHHADRIAKRYRLGESFTGVVLLAIATSLPELATTVTAISVLDNPTLAVHNLLGGVAFQTAIIAIADARKPRSGALTFFAPTFTLLVQGVGLIMLLQLTMGAVVVRGVPSVLSVSVWAVLIAACYAGILYLTYRHRGRPRWTPSEMDDIPAEIRSEHESALEGGAQSGDGDARSAPRLWSTFATFSALVLAGGFVAAQSAEAIASQTGMSDAFLGATLLALATSLPEVSTTLAAVRHERYSVVVSNIFGSNALDVALLFVAEILYRKGSVFDAVGPNVVFVPAIGAIMTCVYLWGLMERENRALLRLGWDSVLAALCYAAGMVVLYHIS